MAADMSIQPDPPLTDLTICDREPIHLSAAIQPHGILLGCCRETLGITTASANAGSFCGRPASELLGLTLSDLLNPAASGAVREALALPPGETLRLARLHPPGSEAALWRAAMHRTEAGILLEAEPSDPQADLVALEHFERLQVATQRLQAASDVAHTCQRLVEEVRRLTSYDRVMLYRFADDWSGEVIAEDGSGALPSYLGLHFPASDIPVQARALYARNVERQIPDVEYEPVPLLRAAPPLPNLTPLDLTQVALRSVSRLHIAYLRNMRVSASMSLSILHRGRLWGLVACHHATPRYVPPELRQAGVMLTQFAAARLSLLEEADIARRSIAVKSVETALLHEAADGRDYRTALLRNSKTLLNLLEATGLVLSNGETITALGETPTGAALDHLLEWLTGRGAGLLVSDHLASIYPPGIHLPEAAGILSVPLGGIPRNLLVWFRPEIARTVTWAGDPIKPTGDLSGEAMLTPRASFAAWSEQVRGRSRPWTPATIAAANGLRDTVVEIIVRRSLDLERMNTQLARSNEELEAFAYVASHDLKEPLRQIETFGTLLQRAFARKTDPAEKVARWFAGIHDSSRRLRRLIDDLTDYSRLGGQAKPFESADLGSLLHEVMKDLDGQLEAIGGRIEVGTLPVVLCDPTQMRQVLQNLLANAIKYHHPARPLVVRVTATMQPAHCNPRPLGLPVSVIRVEDNGVGFDERHRERIFEPFERLHSSDEYEGSGLGLAICRKVIDRHGGVIRATGEPGVGAVFTVAIPIRTPNEQKALGT